jgi:hypothetical protein
MPTSTLAAGRVAAPPTGSFDRITQVLVAMAHLDTPRVADIASRSRLEGTFSRHD